MAKCIKPPEYVLTLNEAEYKALLAVLDGEGDAAALRMANQASYDVLTALCNAESNWQKATSSQQGRGGQRVAGHFIMIPFVTRQRAEEELAKLSVIGRIVEHDSERDELWNRYRQAERMRDDLE